MMTNEDDLRREHAAREYAEFLAKFDEKKTTDDCFTPPEVFAAVHKWVANEYGLQGRRIVRPFFPGGDFITFEYQPDDVVLDNPPFSIVSKIRQFYDECGVDYFLFAPALTLFSTKAPTMLVVGEAIEYANGAKVATSFITSLEPQTRVRTAPELAKALRYARQTKDELPKYAYPDNVRNAALLQRIRNVDFRLPATECEFVSTMDAQAEAGKAIFGGGFIMSDAKALELKAAELKAAEAMATREAIEWPLSARELDVVDRLNAGGGRSVDPHTQHRLFQKMVADCEKSEDEG